MTVNTAELFETDAPALLALDWGTSSLRAYLLDSKGETAVRREAPWGILHLPRPAAEGGFDDALEAVAGDWLTRWPGLPVLAGGMVGSAQGWREAPYVRCPADLSALAGQLACVTARSGATVHIVPGVLLPGRSDSHGNRLHPDVMRGEEVQIAGALSAHPEWAREVCMVLPGTHSKWAWVERGVLTHFATSMAGELFAVLRQHSILGRLMPASGAVEQDPSAFLRGVDAGYHAAPGQLITRLFGVRSLGLTGELQPQALPDYLSGLLIGSELAAMLRGSEVAANTPLVLVGTPELTQRYQRAMQVAGREPEAVLDNTAPQGLWKIAGLAGLVNLQGAKA